MNLLQNQIRFWLVFLMLDLDVRKEEVIFNQCNIIWLMIIKHASLQQIIAVIALTKLPN
jgi:hypothetical protein